jgi:hypothetical protein
MKHTNNAASTWAVHLDGAVHLLEHLAVGAAHLRRGGRGAWLASKSCLSDVERADRLARFCSGFPLLGQLLSQPRPLCEL